MSCRSRFEIWLRNCEWRYESLYCPRESLGLSVFVIFQKKQIPLPHARPSPKAKQKDLKSTYRTHTVFGVFIILTRMTA
jgi:hypothetical protein